MALDQVLRVHDLAGEIVLHKHVPRREPVEIRCSDDATRTQVRRWLELEINRLRQADVFGSK